MKSKYTEQHIREVNDLLASRMTISKASKLVGFSDTSMYYKAVRDLGFEMTPPKARLKKSSEVNFY